jgi:hypothetical protein
VTDSTHATRVKLSYALRIDLHSREQTLLDHNLGDRAVFLQRPLGDARAGVVAERKHAMGWTRLSCHAFRQNTVRLQLHALAYNLTNFLRTLALPAEVEHWSLTAMREKLFKIGARTVRHGRYVVFQLAELAVPRALFTEIRRRIERLRLRPPPVPA